MPQAATADHKISALRNSWPFIVYHLSPIMQGLFSSLADKAQSALNQTPLGRTNSQQGSQGGQSSAAGGILKSHAFESIHHQFRSLQQQYS